MYRSVLVAPGLHECPTAFLQRVALLNGDSVWRSYLWLDETAVSSKC